MVTRALRFVKDRGLTCHFVPKTEAVRPNWHGDDACGAVPFYTAACGQSYTDDRPLVFGDLKLWREYPWYRCRMCLRVLKAKGLQ